LAISWTEVKGDILWNSLEAGQKSKVIIWILCVFEALHFLTKKLKGGKGTFKKTNFRKWEWCIF
jgi:hypothetical protein